MMSSNKALVFRLNDHGQGPELIEQVLLERGWVEFDEEEMEEHEWNLWWRTSRFRNCDYEQICPWQKLNHYPKSTAITKKDSLARNLKRMRAVYGHVYNFSPNAFNLPNDYTKFVADYTRMKDKNPDKVLYWICKPADLSRGRGIFIFRELSELQYDCNAVVQQYITNPMLISGYKFDLRIYVLVPSFHPLTIYVYQEGLVRFSTEKYDLSHLGNMFAHLTNTSINKYSPSYGVDKERIGPGCKWTLTQFRHFLHQAHIDDQFLWTKVINIVVLTLLVQAHQVPKATSCFELYGFDIIIDENLKPWLLEVNFSPALSSDCHTDLIVKKPMLNDLMDLLCFSENDKERGGEQFHHDMQRMSSGQNQRHQSRLGTQKSASRQLRKRSGVGRLPEITAHSGTSMTSYSHRRHIFNQNQTRYDVEGEEEVVPTVPGCGLPSVQHLHPQPRQLSSSSSGRSSACSNGSVEAVSDNKGSVKRQGSASASALTTTNSTKSQPPLLTTTSNQSRKLEVCSELKQPNKAITKIDSKLSLKSDSAISSYYSSSSDHSDSSPMGDDITKITKKVTTNLVQVDEAKTYRKYFSQKKPKSSSNLGYTAVNSKLCTSEDTSKSGISCINSVRNYERNAKGGMIVTGSCRTSPGLSANKSQQNNIQKKRHTSMPFTANPLMTKSALMNRRGSLNNMTRKSQNYPKPWLRSNNAPAPMSTAKKSTARSAPLTCRYGDFLLVFPFNEASRRCSNGNLDTKIVIHECQRLLKEKINIGKGKSVKKKFETEVAKIPKKEESPVADVLPIWGALDEEYVPP